MYQLFIRYLQIYDLWNTFSLEKTNDRKSNEARDIFSFFLFLGVTAYVSHGLLHYKQELEGEDHVSHRLRVTATSCHHLEIHSLRQDVGRWLRLLIGLVSLFSINHPDQ